MEISKIMKKKIILLKERRNQLVSLEREIFNWFESQGLDITSEGFTDVVGGKITYGEYENIEDVEGFLKDYLNGKRE